MKFFKLFLLLEYLINITPVYTYPIEIVNPFLIENSNHELYGIDSIFLINLDKRPEKLKQSINQLKPYNISLIRFPAVNGWALTQKDIDAILQPFNSTMMGARWASKIIEGQKTHKNFYFLEPSCYDQSFGSIFLSPGAIGCFMSHLSIIKNAYESGLERIWILEDDFKVIENPHNLSLLIEKLNQIVGNNGWDILYTDFDNKDAPMYYGINNFKSELKGLDLAWFWRPDIPIDQFKICHRELISDDFIKVGSRMRAHSYIINRTGMKKIVEFYKRKGLFTPYDHELALIPDLNLYSLIYDVVSFEETGSDTRGAL